MKKFSSLDKVKIAIASAALGFASVASSTFAAVDPEVSSFATSTVSQLKDNALYVIGIVVLAALVLIGIRYAWGLATKMTIGRRTMR